MNPSEALEVVLTMAEAYYGREPTFPETLESQKEAIYLLRSHGEITLLDTDSDSE